MTNLCHLRWTNHQGTIMSAFDALLASETLVDVTLACEGKYVRAHRTILSACSSYFHDLVNLDSTKHPVIFLKDVKFTHLQALIQYMYRGKVNIPHADLPDLLDVAKSLKIRGLTKAEPTNGTGVNDGDGIDNQFVLAQSLLSTPVSTPTKSPQVAAINLTPLNLPQSIPMSPPPPPPPLPMSMSGAPSPLTSQQDSSIADEVPTTPSAGPSVVEPLAKKPRIQTRLSTQTRTAEVEAKRGTRSATVLFSAGTGMPAAEIGSQVNRNDVPGPLDVDVPAGLVKVNVRALLDSSVSGCDEGSKKYEPLSQPSFSEYWDRMWQHKSVTDTSVNVKIEVGDQDDTSQIAIAANPGTGTGAPKSKAAATATAVSGCGIAPNSLPCPFCRKPYDRRKKRLQGYYYHVNYGCSEILPRFQCLRCTAAYRKKVEITNHSVRKHPGKSIRFKCNPRMCRADH